jgi:quercetin dioxygenase-like cupin family protein/DNA-binding XRE family transcriptional regulator
LIVVGSPGVPPIGARLRSERLRRDISVRGLAREIGVSASLISQIETEKSSPSVSTLYAITTALGISIEDLFGDRAAAGPVDNAVGPADDPTTSNGSDGAVVGGGAPVPALIAVGDPVVTPFAAAGGGLSTAFMSALAAAGTASTVIATAGGASPGTDATTATATTGAAPADLPVEPNRRLGPVVTPDLREVLTLDSGVTWELLGRIPHRHLDFLLITYQPGGTSSSSGLLMRHSGLEFGFVVSGELTLTLGFDTHRLRAGDAVSFDSSQPHGYRNESTEPAVGVWFVLERST